MAIAPTGAIYKTLTFDGVSSADFGVYITGEAVFNAPQRDVEMVTIPGRNGTFALDNGRFENIEVSYPAGIFADTEADFAEAVSEFRNFLCSRNGYVRLEDDYNASEYRMAVYKSGLEVTPALLKAGEFTLTFDCKPQRWLTSGEEAISVDSGDTITNPTRFEAGPLLEVSGSGEIVLDGETMIIEDVPIGEIKLSDAVSSTHAYLSVTNLNAGDRIYSSASGYPRSTLKITIDSGYTINTLIQQSSNNATCSISHDSQKTYWLVVVGIVDTEFVKGESATCTGTVVLEARFSNGETSLGKTLTIQQTASYNGNWTIQLSNTMSGGGTNPKISRSTRNNSQPAYYGESTKSALPDPLYIDLDIGEAYGELGGEILNLNNVVSIPANLPKLRVGETEITFDNTITNLDVIPRWWRV